MKDRREYVQGWLRKAENDMKIALREMQADDSAPDAVCFHFQQAAEKLLKAYLIWRETEYKPTHNIEVLLAACEKHDPAFKDLRRVESLTPYAVEVRYADDLYFPTREEMEQAAGMARDTEDFVRDKLTTIGFVSPEE